MTDLDAIDPGGIGILGVDPGQSGGLALIGKCLGESFIHAHPMPKTERDTWELIMRLAGDADFAVIEKVGSMPGQGVTSMFSFGRSVGFLRACLIAAEVPFEEVTPQTWQKAFGLIKSRKKGAKPESKTAKKNRNKARAQELWPDQTITHAKADAMLIAEWGWRTHRRDS